MSLTESMRKDPDKFNAFIFCDNKSSSSTTQTRGYNQYYDTASYGQQQQYPSQDCIDVLLEEAEKLYNKLAKDCINKTVESIKTTNEASDSESSKLSSLPRKELSDIQKDSTQKLAADYTYRKGEEHTFIQSEEIDNEEQGN